MVVACPALSSAGRSTRPHRQLASRMLPDCRGEARCPGRARVGEHLARSLSYFVRISHTLARRPRRFRCRAACRKPHAAARQRCCRPPAPGKARLQRLPQRRGVRSRCPAAALLLRLRPELAAGSCACARLARGRPLRPPLGATTRAPCGAVPEPRRRICAMHRLSRASRVQSCSRLRASRFPPAQNPGACLSRADACAPAPRRCRPGALPRSARVGVLGGGQLGRMLAIAAVRRRRLRPSLCAALTRRRRAQAPLDVRVAVLDLTPAAPASVAAAQTVGSFRDAAAVRSFAATVDVLTVEIEHVDAVRLRFLCNPAIRVRALALTCLLGLSGDAAGDRG